MKKFYLSTLLTLSIICGSTASALSTQPNLNPQAKILLTICTTSCQLCATAALDLSLTSSNPRR